MGEKKIIAYKGFDHRLKCRGFQYNVGETYEQEGKIECCHNGFHACTNPIDVLNYYEMDYKNRFCMVEQYGEIDSTQSDTKTSSSKIKIKAEIGAIGLFKAYILWMKEMLNPFKLIMEAKEDTSPSDTQNFSYDNCNSITSTTNQAKIGTTVHNTRITLSAYGSNVGSSGKRTIIATSGTSAKILSSGDNGIISSSGAFNHICSSGDDTVIASSGTKEIIASSGKSTRIATSGLAAKIGSSGDYTSIATSGFDDRIVSSGNSSRMATTANLSQVESLGDDSVIFCGGHNSIAKAKVGSWITLSEWEYSEKKGYNIPKCVKTEYVDGKRIKGDTWYWLKDGEFKEVNM